MIESNEIRGVITRPLGSGEARVDNVVSDIKARIHSHNTALEGFSSSLERLVGDLPPSGASPDSVKRVLSSGLGGDIGNLESTVDQQQAILDRIGCQIRRLMKE